MLSPRCLALLLAFLSLPSPSLHAQTAAVVFTGTPGYTQAELLAYSHLQPEQASMQQALQDAAQRLSDTGLFADVRFVSNARNVTFTLKPMPPGGILPAHFTNFLWWQPAELSTILQQRVPLFRGSVPLTGNLQDAIIAALQSMLTERGVTAIIAAIPSGAPGATPSAISFSIQSPEVLVHRVAVANSAPAMQASLAPVLDNLAARPYEEGATPRAIAEEIAEAYRNAGYLDIGVGPVTHGAPIFTPRAIRVDFTAAVNEGAVYRIAALSWPGSPLVSAADFEKATKLHAGDIASQQALRQSLGLIARAYYSKGYQDAKVRAPATLDNAAHTVAYTISVLSGEQYRVRSVKTDGLSAQQQKDFLASWHMNEGDFYDATYMNSFLVTRSTPASLRGISAKWRAVSDPNTHLVDLTLTFHEGGTLIEVH